MKELVKTETGLQLSLKTLQCVKTYSNASFCSLSCLFSSARLASTTCSSCNLASKIAVAAYKENICRLCSLLSESCLNLHLWHLLPLSKRSVWVQRFWQLCHTVQLPEPICKVLPPPKRRFSFSLDQNIHWSICGLAIS